MWEDPIVAEVHRIREQLAAQYNFDVEVMFADMQKRQAALGSRLVRQRKHAKLAAEGDCSTPPDSVPPRKSPAA